MKRRIIGILLFLALGAVVNIAVAWGCAVCITTLPYSGGGLVFDVLPKSEAMRYWNDGRPDDFPSHPTRASEWRGLGYRRIQLKTPPTDDFGFIDQYYRIDVSVGWPVFSFKGGFWQMEGLYPKPPRHKPHNAIMIGVHEDLAMIFPGERVLPLGVISWGFAINTLFYASILGLIFFGLLALRRHLRLRKARLAGCCPVCRYDLRGDLAAGCPECGSKREEPATASERSESAV